MKAPKTQSQLSKLQLAEQYARQLADLLAACDEPILAARADGFAQTIDMTRTIASTVAVTA